ncbi:MAG: hypothetical protein GY909_14685 [Oligoflexia bacterium]|nr:hypothetical protein [Oligoflexia bacterium]
MKLKALLLTSNSLRHKFFIQECSRTFDVVGVISERKKNYYVKSKQESELVREHFKKLSLYEEKFFKVENNVKVTIVEDINDLKVVEKYIDKVDVVLLYGTSILKEVWLDNFEKIVNLHLGLSPYYKGSATLFWPFFDDKLEYLGTTIHIANKEVDAGAIIETILPDKDTLSLSYYDITTSLIHKSLKLYPSIVKKYLEGDLSPQGQSADLNIRISKKKDFNEDVLKKVLSKYSGSELS